MSNFRHLLLSRPDRMGDVIISLSLIDPVLKSIPGVAVSMLVRDSYAPLLNLDNRLSKVHGYDEKAGFWQRVRRFRAQMNCWRPDAVIHLHPEPALHLGARLAHIPVRVGYRKGWIRAHSASLPYRRHLGEKHEAEYGFELLRPLGLELAAPPLPRLSLAKKGVPSPLKGRIEGPYAVIHPFSHGSKPTWPATHFAKLAARVVEDHRLHLVLVGSSPDRNIGRSILAALPPKGPRPVDLVNQTTLPELAGVIRDARFLVSRDSGPAHLSAALGTPTLTLMGQCDPIHSPVRWKPLGARAHTIVRDLPAQAGESRWKRWERSFADIAVEEVLEWVAEVV